MTAATPPVAVARRGHWLTEIDRNRRLLGVFGIGLVAVAVAVVVAVFALFGGDFTSFRSVRVELPLGASAVSEHSSVEFRGVTIGEVAGTSPSSTAGHTIVIAHLKPGMLSSVPANVIATVAPVSIFGNQYIVLEPPSQPQGMLAAGATIMPAGTGQSVTVQDTIANLDELLVELHPAQLDEALSAVAQAIQGQGQSLGVTLVRASTYLRQMQPLWPTAVEDLRLLIPLGNQLAASSPDLISMLSHVSTTAGTLTAQQANLSTLFGQGSATAASAAGIFASSGPSLEAMINGAAPILDDISANPSEIAQLLSGLTQFSNAFVAATADGPYISATAQVDVVNPANLGLAALGGPTMLANLAAGLGKGIVNPPTYTTADCPAFATLHCTGTGATTSSSVAVSAASADAAGVVSSALSGGTRTSPAVSSLLLGPVLDGLVRS